MTAAAGWTRTVASAGAGRNIIYSTTKPVSSSLLFVLLYTFADRLTQARQILTNIRLEIVPAQFQPRGEKFTQRRCRPPVWPVVPLCRYRHKPTDKLAIASVFHNNYCLCPPLVCWRVWPLVLCLSACVTSRLISHCSREEECVTCGQSADRSAAKTFPLNIHSFRVNKGNTAVQTVEPGTARV